jgi:hypothetical protein
LRVMWFAACILGGWILLTVSLANDNLLISVYDRE